MKTESLFFFMVVMTGWAMIVNIEGFFDTGNWLLVAINAIIIVFVAWMIVEVVRVVRTFSSSAGR